MFHSARKTMKWSTLLKDIKEKVGLTPSSTSSSFPSAVSSSPSASPARGSSSGEGGVASLWNHASHGDSSSPSRGSYELELEFKRYWEQFRSSSSEKEKETVLNMAVDIFCKLVKWHADAAQLVTTLVETHIFSFVVGRAFVSDIEKLRVHNKTKLLVVGKVMDFFSLVTKEGISPGSNLLYAIEVLVSGPVDKQPFLDAGIFCCLIYILNAFLNPVDKNQSQIPDTENLGNAISIGRTVHEDKLQVRRLEVEGSIVHIMKTLASHSSAALSLIEDDSLKLLFQMVATGSLSVFSKFKQGHVPLHSIQLYRHAMQILGLLLLNDNGMTTKYIRKHQLIKVLLMTVKDFNPEDGDPAYTMGIVDLLMECVELSYRPEAGQIKLKEDIHNAHGYQFLVQFALTLSHLQEKQVLPSVYSTGGNSMVDDIVFHHEERENTGNGDASSANISPALSRLLDVIVNLAQIGPIEPTGHSGRKVSKTMHGKPGGHNRTCTSSSESISEEIWEKDNSRIRDVEAIQMLQDIFLKSACVELQSEVLNRIFKIFSSHLDNYRFCQELRTVPLFVQNMAGFPASLQETILKILEYAVTVVNCVPEQELLSLCCLLQQPITSDLKYAILSFFVKLLSFDRKYKKVLREVGALDVLIDDLKQHSFISGANEQRNNAVDLSKKSSISFEDHINNNEAIFSSPMLSGSYSGKLNLFEDESTASVAWDCLGSLLKKAEANQSSFRSANGFPILLPFLVHDIHRSGVLRILSSLIIDDIKQVHPEELGAIIEILKSGMVTNLLGVQFKIPNDAKCDILGTVWRILVVNSSAQRVFGEATGFSLLLTTLHIFQTEGESEDIQHILSMQMKVFAFLLRVMTAAVSNNAINRLRLHTIISSQAFYDLLSESSLLTDELERQVVQLFLELALEIVLPPSNSMQAGSATSSDIPETFFSNVSTASFKADKERVYNGSAVGVLIRSILHLTPKLQLELLIFIQKLASAGPFNQENLTSIGCVGLLLDMVGPLLNGASSLLVHAFKIVQILGAYRLSTTELRVLISYIFQKKSANSGHYLVDMMEKLIQAQDTRLENVSLAPFVEMDMSKMGHASIQVSLGERTWPPTAGYSFVCWFQYCNLLKRSANYEQQSKIGCVSSSSNGSHSGDHVVHIFSVGAVDDGDTFYAELSLQDNGVLTLATSNSCSTSSPGLEMEEGKWHHLAVVHSKPNALAGLFQSSVAYVYLNGKLRHTGKLGYSLSPVGKSLQVTIGTPATHAKVSELSWRLRSCYLFEEVLTSGSICFMYILGRGYKGIFQDTNLLQFIPNQACGGGSMAILDSLDMESSSVSNMQKLDNANRQASVKSDGSGIVWDLERLSDLSLQLSGKRLIFAFDGTPYDAFKTSGTLSMLNLVDPMSAAASPIGGIPRFSRLTGDSYICRQFVIGDTIRAVGGIATILSFVEASETRDMLHMSLVLLSCALHQNPQNVLDMQAYRGYHLLAIFLHHRMPLFDMQALDTFFHIAACEASFLESSKLQGNAASSSIRTSETSFEDLSLPKYSDEYSSIEPLGDLDDFYVPKDSFNHFHMLDSSGLPNEMANCIVLCNADMVEHVLLDWTLWVTAPVSIQLALLGFLERMVSMHWYRNHNLTLLRQINLVQHLLVTLQRGDVEVQVLEKLVVLLGVILEDGFLTSELEVVVRFVIMTFDPPELRSQHQIIRETMGKHVIVRNMLLEMLIDLQVTITSEELLEQWHKVVSSKLITYFLDEAVHPTSMRWIMTLLGICLTSSPTFTQRFQNHGGYQSLTRVLPSFYDYPDIYYIIFCLIFDKAVYPRVPEVSMGDFHALMSSDGCYGELKFVELLDPVIAMAKCTFDRLSVQAMHAHKNGGFSHSNVSLVADLVEAPSDDGGELQAEALKHKTSARLMGGEAAAPAAAMSVLRFMVDLGKMCPSFSSICRRMEFLESCVDLYFSCVRAYCAVKRTKNLTSGAVQDENFNSDSQSLQQTLCSLPQEQGQSTKTSITLTSFPQAVNSVSSEDSTPDMQSSIPDGNVEIKREPFTFKEDAQTIHTSDSESAEQMSAMTYSTHDLSFHDYNGSLDTSHSIDIPSSASAAPPECSPHLSEKSNAKISWTPSSPGVASTSWLGSSGSNNEARLTSAPSMQTSVSEMDMSPDLSSDSQGLFTVNALFPISPQLLAEVDDLAYGGGPCTAAATAVLDFIAVALADIVSEQAKATQIVESILEAVPMYVRDDSVFIYQGHCLSRLMNFLERRLLRDDEEEEKKLDKSRWSVNLDALSWTIVDRVYMGVFPQPIGALKTLEFLLSMLQLANKDGRIEEIVPSGKGLLSITRGSRQLEMYINALLKNAKRMIMYCFLPSFLIAIQDDESTMDISTVLQLIIANKRLVLCPSNHDTEIISCLLINLISLIRDERQHTQNMAIDVIKYLLLHGRAALEEFLVLKSTQGSDVDILHGGFDKLLTGNYSSFFEWFLNSESVINKVLQQCASIMWEQYISSSAKFPAVRIKGLEGRRKREMGRKSRDVSKLDLRHWDKINERRYALEVVRDSMATELRVIRQDKYGWVLHAESEWQTHLQQLVHERGIFPFCNSTLEPEWQLCPIEGPYRMRKRLERCKLKAEVIQNILISGMELKNIKPDKEPEENDFAASESDTKPFFNFLPDDANQEIFDVNDFDEPYFKDAEEFKDVDTISAQMGWNDGESSINEGSLHSAPDYGAKSSEYSIPLTDQMNAQFDIGSPRPSSSMKVDEMRITETKSEKELLDNGEYLIRPYLEPSEKIRFRYNCERVVGLDKHDGIFLIGSLCLYVIENFYIDDSGCICEKQNEDELSIIDQALGVKKDVTSSLDFQSKSSSTWGSTVKAFVGGRAWAYNGGAWGKEKICSSGNLPHLWHMWKLDSVHELLKRDYQLRPVAIEIFSMDGYNDLLVFHKKERDDVFKNLVSLNLPRNSMLDATISGSSKQESNEGSRLFKVMAKSFSKRWQNGEISNFQYLMHLNTLAGRGYSDLTQYPVFPWVIADYESETLDLTDPKIFRKLNKPMGCQTEEGEEEFRKRYESWDDPDVPKFHYGSHYSSAGIVLFYLLRLPPFSAENQKLQGGQFDHADRLFNSVRDTWLSAASKCNTSDVKELIPEFFYMPEFLENRFDLDLGEKQSGEKVGDVLLPAWARGSVREFIKKHREALECDYVSENLHHWIDLIFGYKQRGKAAEEAVNVFYHYTYEGSVDIDSVSDPAMKASILAQINHFGQTPKHLFLKPHVKRRTDRKIPPHPLRHCSHLLPHNLQKSSSAVSQIVWFREKILIAEMNKLLKPVTYSKYIAWGFPDRSLRFLSYDQDKLLSTHESLHGGNQIQCVGVTHDGQVLATGADDGVVAVWRISKDGLRGQRQLKLERALCAHTAKITCLYVSQPYMLMVTGSDDCTVILWDLSGLAFVKQLSEFPAPVSAIYVNDLTGEIATASGILLAVWSVNGDCLAVVNTSQLPSDSILSVTSTIYNDWQDTNWYVTGHQSGAVKIWNMVHSSVDDPTSRSKTSSNGTVGIRMVGKAPEYRLVLRKVLKSHKHPVTALHLTADYKQLMSGDSAGHLLSWTLPGESLKAENIK